MTMIPQDRARADIVDYCLTKRDRWHGYDSIPGQIDHDLANAYASVAEALTDQQPEPVIDGFALSDHPAARAHQATLVKRGVVAGEMFHRAVLDELGMTLAEITSREVELLVAVTRVHRQLTEQPEPVSRDEIVDMFEAEFADAPTYVVVEHLLSRYTITARPVASPSEEAQRG